MSYAEDRAKAQAWAKWILDEGGVILDTETTGLDEKAQVVQVAAIDTSGNILLNALVKPTCAIPREASAIHGITDEMVALAAPMNSIIGVLSALTHRRRVIIYNAAYDTRIIRQSVAAVGLVTSKELFGRVECAMLNYSQYVGEWNEHYGNYRWQRLPYGDHSALGDCLATLKIIREMARVSSRSSGEATEEIEIPF